ncbi:MAG: type II secretion system F family protein [Nanoarchaeota archaeon]
MIDEIRQNIGTEIEMLREISNYLIRLDYASPSERKLLITAIESLRGSIKLINNSIPGLINEISIINKLPAISSKTDLEKIKFKGAKSLINVTIKKEDRENFLKELSLNDSLLGKIKKKQPADIEKFEEFKASRGYIKLSNKVFLNNALALLNQGYFKSLSFELKKSNIDVLLAAYVATTLFTVFISFFLSILISTFLIFVKINLIAPYFSLYNSGFLLRIIYLIWIPIIIPIFVFFIMYYYPGTERRSMAKKIDQEMPFVVIHMSAISGSGIEPSEIFKIIAVNKEYPYLRRELRKVINQINLHGFDLITSLNNVSRTTPSTKLAELFSGIATTITSGGDLQDFFEKRSESLLATYRLDREKYTKIAETFMDMYITVVLAAPMILMVLLVMISVSAAGSNFSSLNMTVLIIGIISLINVLFLILLHLKQPAY